MVYFGKIVNGAIVLDGDIQLPDGTRVTVELADSGATPENDPLYQLPDLAMPSGIPDLAVNIDHYLYGHPKVVNDQ